MFICCIASTYFVLTFVVTTLGTYGCERVNTVELARLLKRAIITEWQQTIITFH